MGVDYFIHRGCSVQRGLAPDGFLAAMARRRQTQLFHARELVLDGEPVKLVQPHGAIAVYTLRDGRVETSSLSADATDELAKWAPQCDGCQARAFDRPFGCYGFIGYPIQAATEQWLVQRARDMGLAAVVALNVLAQMGITGEHAAELRARGGTFFESPTPQGIVWELADGGQIVLTSDVIIELAVFRLPHAFEALFPLAAVLLGLVPPHAATVDAMMSWMKFPRMLGAQLAAPEPDAEHQNLVDYLNQLIAAARSGFGLIVDG